MLKIYGFKLSSPSNKVEMCANLLGLDYEFVHINLVEKAHQQPQYLAIHPAGKVPAIDDDGFVLFESNAIMRYLAAKANSDYYPAELQARALVDQWIDFASGQIGTNISRLVFNTLFAPRLDIEVDQRSLADGNTFLARFLPIIETQLSDNAYLAGDALSIADIVLLTCLDPVEVIAYDLSPYPCLIKWRHQLSAQDFYQNVHQSYGEGLLG